MKTSGEDSPRAHIGLAFHPPAHYRLSLLKHLENDPRFTIDLLFDEKRSRQPITHVAPSDVSSHQPLTFHMFGNFVWMSGLLRRIMRRDYDLLIMTGDVHDLSTWCALILTRAMRIPSLLWTQGWRQSEPNAKGKIRVLFYRLSRGLLVYSSGSKSLGIEAGYPPEKISTVYNSVRDSEEAEQGLTEYEIGDLIQAYGFSKDKPRIIFSSRIKSLKRPELLVEAASILQTNSTPIELIFVGSGEELENTKRMANDLGVETHFLGEIYDPAVLAALYSVSECAVLPSHAGLAVIHALQHGTPVVVDDDSSGNGPETEAVIPEVTGQVYSAGSVSSLATAILKAIDMAAEPHVRESCRRMARDVWSAQNQAKLIGDAVVNILGD